MKANTVRALETCHAVRPIQKRRHEERHFHPDDRVPVCALEDLGPAPSHMQFALKLNF
jgi:hypothetical protein